MATAQTYIGDMSGAFSLKDQDGVIIKRLDLTGSIKTLGNVESGMKKINAEVASQALDLGGIAFVSAFAWKAFDQTNGAAKSVTLEFTHGGGDKSLSRTSEGYFLVEEGVAEITGIKVTTSSGNSTVLEYAVAG